MAAFHLIVQNLDGSISFENTNLEGSISFSQDTEGGGIDMLLSCLLRYFLGISSTGEDISWAFHDDDAGSNPSRHKFLKIKLLTAFICSR